MGIKRNHALERMVVLEDDCKRGLSRNDACTCDHAVLGKTTIVVMHATVHESQLLSQLLSQLWGPTPAGIALREWGEARNDDDDDDYDDDGDGNGDGDGDDDGDGDGDDDDDDDSMLLMV